MTRISHETHETGVLSSPGTSGRSSDTRTLAILALGFGCMIGYVRMCSLGFVGYLSYEVSSALDQWYVLRTVCELAALALLALAGWKRWFKLGLKSFSAAVVFAIASAIVFAVDTSGVTGALVAAAGGVSSAVLMYAWMLLMSSYPVRTVVIASLAGLVVSGAAIEGAPLVGPDLGLVIAVATAFGAGACAVLCDSDLRCCEPDGPFDASARLRTPWLTVAMTVACGFFVTVLYGVAEYMTWLYDWQPNYIAFGVAALAVMVSTAGVLLRTRSWMHTVWVPLFAVFTLAIVFSCLPTRAFVQVAVGFMMAAVFASHFLCWMVFPSLFSALKVPRAFAAGAVLVLTNSSLASLAGDALGSVLPRSMQNLGSVAGIMAIVVAVLFAVTFVLNRNRIGAVGVLGGDARQREGAGFALAGGVAPAMAEVAAGAADTFSVGADADDGSRLGGEAAEISQVWEPDAAEPEPPSLVDSLKSRLDDMGVQYGLTPRELEVAFYTVQGFSCAYIADKLVVSNSTVRFHQQNIYRKFDVHSRNELIEAVTVE